METRRHSLRACGTYIPVRGGFFYLVAVMDWASRFVLAWELDNTLEVGFCVSAMAEALRRHGTPAISNTDQGSQFTSEAFLRPLLDAGVRISMDGKGLFRDNQDENAATIKMRKPMLRAWGGRA